MARPQAKYGSVLRHELATTLKEALGELEFARLMASRPFYYTNDDAFHGDANAFQGDALSKRLPGTFCNSLGGVFGVGCDESAWEAIAACDETAPSLTAKIEDAWDSSKRSREYLNAREGDLYARYFAHAARDRATPANTWK